MPKQQEEVKPTIDPCTIKLVNVRLSYPAIFIARDYKNDGKFSYSSHFLFPKSRKELVEEIEETMIIAAERKWEKKAKDMIAKFRASGKLALRDGDLKEDDGYIDHWYVAAKRSSTKPKPRVVDQNNRELTATDGIPYGGCYVIGSVNFWGQNNEFGQRINADLRGVQFMRDGDPFSGSKPVRDDEFEEISDDSGDLA
jgi:Protein of unknown function (DUF2815)